MLSRLPPWIEYGAFTLAMLAGTVNAVGLLGFQHQSVSHLSGSATMLGVELSALSASSWHLLAILLSFLLGAIVSGTVLSSPSLKLGRHYDSLLMTEGLLLLLAIYMLRGHALWGHYLASMACGLQNALVTNYSGAIIRTTHVTGIVTDLGLMIGAVIRGEKFDKRKCILFLLVLTGFIVGGIVGAILFVHYSFMALLLPVAICFGLALGYRAYIYSQA